MSATVTCLLEGGHPCSWKSLLGEGSVSLTDQIPPLSHWSDNWSCNSQCVDPQSLLLCSSWGVVFLIICWSVDLIYMSLALKIGRMVMNVTYCYLWIDNLKSFYIWTMCIVSMWCAVLRLMAMASIGGVQSSWAASVVVASIPVLWSRVASVGIMMTQVVMSVKVWLSSGLASPVSVFMVVSWTRSGMVIPVRFVVNHWSSQRRYLVWTIHGNVTIFVTLTTSNMRAISCYMSLCLTLETVIFFVWHYIVCGRCDNCSCELLCSIKLFHFWNGICEHLKSLFIDAHGQTMGILQSFDTDSDGSGIICEVAPPSLCLKLVDICCKGFLFPLLTLSETHGIRMDISIAKFGPYASCLLPSLLRCCSCLLCLLF